MLVSHPYSVLASQLKAACQIYESIVNENFWHILHVLDVLYITTQLAGIYKLATMNK